MDWSSIKEMVAKVAPIAGTLLGGPAGAAVGGLISSALGVEAKPEAVMAALGNPDNMIKLKEMESAERQHLLFMQVEELKATNTYNLEKLKVETADTQSARSNHKQSMIPAVIVVFLSLMVAAGGYMLFTMTIPSENKEFAHLLFGALLVKWGDSIAYWVGTTRSSAEKTSLLRR